MLFCGQCGLHLSSNDKLCPRCGTPVEPGIPQGDDVQSDAPTVASPSLLGQMETQVTVTPDKADNPQKLVLHPEQTTGSPSYATPDAYEATRRVESPQQGYGPALPGTPSYPAPSQASYPQQPSNNNYPIQDMYAEYPQSGSNYAPQGSAYPNYTPVLNREYQPHPELAARASSQARGRTMALLLILFGLLFILAAMTLLILEKNNVLGSIHTVHFNAVAIIAHYK